MSLLEHPEAQALLDDANVAAGLRPATAPSRLTGFLQRYLPCRKFYRVERRDNATTVIRGLLSGLERKSCEPIAIAAGLARKPIQFFVGAGKWDDEDVMAEVRTHVREECSPRPTAVVVIDPSAFPKKGTESCGVARQWCGRLGKVDNCQVGVFLAYAARAGYAPLDRRLYLPEDWANDAAGREKCHVPPEVEFAGRDLADRQPGPAGTAACRACPTAGSWAMTNWAGPHAEFRAALRRRPGSVTCWTCPVTRRCVIGSGVAHHGKKAGVGRKPRGAVCEGRCGPRASRSRGGSGSPSATAKKRPAAGRCDDGASPDQARRSNRAGGAPGRDPSGGRVADRLRDDRRGPRGVAGRGGRAQRQRHPRSRRCSGRARVIGGGSTTTRCGAGWDGTTI